MKRALALITTVALIAPQVALAQEEDEFDPSHEFEQNEWVPIHIGPLDLSITKAVAYLMLGSVITMAIGILLMRWRTSLRPDRRQSAGELI